MLLPALSITQNIAGIYVQNRILWLPIGLIILFYSPYNKLHKFHKPIAVLSLFFLFYCAFAVINHWDFNIYFGYFLTFLLLFVSSNIVYCNKSTFIEFFKLFLILNTIYVAYQMVCCNLGLQSLAMIQSNLPAQKNVGYVIPPFATSFLFRYTGLFNESSPFAFYLCISFCFFKCLGEQYKKYKNIALVMILFSGSKFAYLFLLCYIGFFIRNKFINTVALIALAVVTYMILTDLSVLIEMTNGEMASIKNRMQDMEDIGMEEDITNWGNGLKTSSDGEMALNMFSILLGGFGRYGFAVILLMIVWFYQSIDYKQKHIFILPFAIGMLSNGSLLIMQYSLLAYCLIYLHNRNTVEFDH